MNVIERIDAPTHSFDVHPGLFIRARELGAGDACIIPKAEGRAVQVIDPAIFVRTTP